MKATGVTRQVDELGRVSIPKELRRTLGIEIKDPIAFFVDGETIILCKHRSGCFVCGEVKDDTRHFHGQEVCSSCIGELAAVLSKSQVAATAQS